MELKPGDKVHYCPTHYQENGRFENGIVKSIHPSKEAAFVVYNCNGEWHRIHDYTAACTMNEDLRKGWR